MKKTRENNGITLIALIITIIVLLILAGVAVAQLSENGLFEKTRIAKEKYDEAERKETEILSDYEVISRRDGVTLTQEQYEKLKPKSFAQAELLMTTYNNNLTRTTLDLKSFTSTYETAFSDYMTYNNTTGELKVNEDGWYFINAESDCRSTVYYTDTKLYMSVNDKEIKVLERFNS